MLRPISLSLLLVLSIVGYGQSYMDSLKNAFRLGTNDSLKADAALEICWELAWDEADTAIYYGLAAKTSAERRKNNYQLLRAYDRLAQAYDTKKQTALVLYYFNQGIALAKQINDVAFVGKLYNNLALSYYYRGVVDSSLYWHFQSLQTRKKTGDLKEIGQSLNNIGLLFRVKKDYPAAIDYYRQSLAIKNQIDDKKGALNTLINIAACYKNSKQYDSCIFYSAVAERLANSLDRKKDAAAAITNAGLSMVALGKYQQALNKLLQLDKVGDKDISADTENYHELTGGIGEAYLGLEQYDKAIVYFLKALQLAVGGNKLEFEAQINHLLATAYEAKGDFVAALRYQKQFKLLNDSLFNISNIESMNELSTRFETEKKEVQIKALEAENKLKQQQNRLYLALVVIAVLLIGLALWAYWQKTKANAILQQQQQEIINKTAQLNQQAAEIARLQTQMNPHFIFNAINSIQHLVMKGDVQPSLDYLNDFGRLMRMILNNSEKEFISLQEETNFLHQYLKFELLRFQHPFSYSIDVANELDIESTYLPPMLVQPYIENAVKHGLLPQTEKGILHVEFRLITKQSIDYLSITIADNGVGIDAAEKRKVGLVQLDRSMGMHITAKRIAKLYETENVPLLEDVVQLSTNESGSGTVVRIFIPLIEQY
jgi:tetratricopeptide (TPR) repeat protein